MAADLFTDEPASTTQWQPHYPETDEVATANEPPRQEPIDSANALAQMYAEWDEPQQVANAGNTTTEQQQPTTTQFVGVRDPDRPGAFRGQVGVQWNPQDGSQTAYGLWGASYQFPQGATREQIAGGQYDALRLYPPAGPGQSRGYGNVNTLKDAIAELGSGRLDAAETNRVEHWVRGEIDGAYAGNRQGWDPAALNNFHDLTGQFSRKQQQISDRGEAAVHGLQDALSLSSTRTHDDLNDALATARSEHQRFGSHWSDATREEYAKLEPEAVKRLQASAPGTETSIDSDGQSHSITVPHPQFIDGNGKPYDPTTTDSQGRRWIDADELAHHLRNTGVPVTSSWLIANNPARAHPLGGEYQFMVGDEIRAPRATGTAATAGDSEPATAPGTTVRLLPGAGATVIGTSSAALGGGAFILTPNQGVADAVMNGDPSKLWESGLSQSSLFVTGSGAVTGLLSSLGLPANSPAFETAKRLGPNAVATYKFADGSLEVGAGGGQALAGGNAFGFWNGRVEAANQDGLFPNGARVSGNGGVLGNVGSWASRGIGNAGSALSRAPDPRARGVGAFLQGIGAGSAALGTATGTNFWVGQAGRVDITRNGEGPLTVLGPDGKPLAGGGEDGASVKPGSQNFGSEYLARANLLDHLYSGTRVWTLAAGEDAAARQRGAEPDSHDIAALELAQRVNETLWDAGALPRNEHVTSTADAGARLQRLHDSYLRQAVDDDGNIDPRRSASLQRASQLLESLSNDSGVNFGWDLLEARNRERFGDQLDQNSAQTRYFFNPEGVFTPRRTVPGGMPDAVG